MSERLTHGGSGVLIRVFDLNVQRIFYRDMLKLGEPVVDSNFWTEFAAPDGTRIILEKTEAAYLVLYTPHLDEVRQELALHNYPITANTKPHPGEVFYRGQDPEGNVFYLCTL